MDLQGGPTFEDLSIDDDLTQLQRVVRYSSSSIALQRLVHVKMLAETMAAVGFEQSVKSVVPLIGPLAEDLEYVVRQHLGEQLDDIARFCRAAGKEAGYRLIIEVVLPILANLLGDSHPDVRQAAGESLVGVASLMKPLDLGHHVLTIVLQLAHDDEQEELRMTAAALLNDLAEALGNDLCKQFVTPEMESLSEDPVFRVRKATALNLHKICKVVGDAGIQRLLPAYVRLTKDDVYRVRKACADALVEMSNAVGAEASLRELTPVFLNLVSDSSKIVRTVALENLGRLISTLPGESVSQELVRYFTGTAVESMGDPSSDADLRLYCAFSFPAVVVTIGPDRWCELRESFAALLRDPSWSVRKTLSFSLHEVAKVLHPDDVESDLVPAMEAFLRDMEDVRLGVIRHLADFSRNGAPPKREAPERARRDPPNNVAFNWRLREVLAQQLPRLAPLLTPDSVFFAVVPVAFGLLNDPVAVVRERTFEVVAPLLQLAGVHSSARQASMVARVRELAHANTYQARQMYVYICHSMVCGASATHERPLFVQEFVPSLAELARDNVVNVRIAMSRTLSNCPDWVMELKVIQTAIRHLVKDSNPDVRHFVSFLPPILGHDTSQEDKVPCVDSSSVLSDESMLTQWSVSTQRSMLSVGDFPPVRDASSPNSRSFKLGRQRSSSGESAGESGNSTTSEEGEGLKRLSSRRPPLPAGWGLPYASPLGAAAADGGVGGGGVGGASTEAGGKSDDTLSESDGGNPPQEVDAWGAGEGGGNGLAEGGANDADNGDSSGGGRREDEVGAVDVIGAREGSSPENEVLSFEREVVGEPEDDAPLPPSPKRANSQDSAVIDDDAAAEECPPLTLEAGGDDTPLGQAGVSVGVVQEAVMPPTPVPDRGALAAGGLGQGAFVFDFGGDFLDVPQPPQRGELNLTPPPWDGGRMGSGGVFSPPLDMSPPAAPAPVVPPEVKSDGFESEGVANGRGEEAAPSPGGIGEVRRGDDELGGAEEEKGRGGEKMDDTPLLLSVSEELSAPEESAVEGGLVEKKVDVGGELDEEDTVGAVGELDEELIGVAEQLDDEPVGIAGELEEEIIGVAGELGDETVDVAEELEDELIEVAGGLNEIIGVGGESDQEIVCAAGKLDELDEEVVGVGGESNEERAGVGGELDGEKAGVGGGVNEEPIGLGGELDEETIGLEGGLDEEPIALGRELDEETIEARAAASPPASPDRETVSDGSSLCTTGVEDARGESAGCGTSTTEAAVQEQEAGRVVVSLAEGEGECADEQEALPLAHGTQGAGASAADLCVISACMAVGKGLEEAERAVGVDSVDDRGGVRISEQKSKKCGGVEGAGGAGGDAERK